MNIFSCEKNALGEGPLWHSDRNSLFWLDILNRKLFEKKLAKHSFTADRTWLLPEFTSAIAMANHERNSLWMITDKSFGKFDLLKRAYKPVIGLNIGDSFRANDGGVSPDGAFWFGTMEWSPSGLNGGVYSISPAAVLKKQDVRIGIPNTFGWSADGKIVYISDSFQQKMFSFEVENHAIKKKTARLVVDLSMGESTPDGGATDIEGYLWTAHWDGHKVVKYDHAGELHQELPVPVPRPTSCCFGGPENRHLFVTSASSGMSAEELGKYPLSGNVFVQELAYPGQTRLPFNMDN